MTTCTQAKTDDAVGNRTSVDDSANAGPEYYGINGLNQYTGFNVAGGTGMAFYDTNGNLTGMSSSQGTRTFSYDALNRLTGTTQSGPYNNLPGAPVGTQDTQVYYYDARNRCVARVVTKWAASEWLIERVLTTYTYDGWNVIETFSGYSPSQLQGSQSAEYVHGANVDEIVRAESRPRRMIRANHFMNLPCNLFIASSCHETPAALSRPRRHGPRAAHAGWSAVH